MKTFGEALREQLNDKRMTAAELSRRSGVTKQNIGRLLNNTPHPITGALPKVERVTVDRLAQHGAGHLRMQQTFDYTVFDYEAAMQAKTILDGSE